MEERSSLSKPTWATSKAWSTFTKSARRSSTRYVGVKATKLTHQLDFLVNNAGYSSNWKDTSAMVRAVKVQSAETVGQRHDSGRQAFLYRRVSFLPRD